MKGIKFTEIAKYNMSKGQKRRHKNNPVTKKQKKKWSISGKKFYLTAKGKKRKKEISKGLKVSMLGNTNAKGKRTK